MGDTRPKDNHFLFYTASSLLGFVIALFIIKLPWQNAQDAVVIVVCALSAVSFTFFLLRSGGMAMRQAYEDNIKLIAFASHEIRKSMTVFKWGFTLLLNKDLGQLTDDQNDLMSKMSKETESLIRLTNDFLDITKLELHKLEIVLKRISFDEIEEELQLRIKKMISDAMAKQLTIRQQIQLRHGLFIQADLLRIMHVVNNFIENAIRYTPVGGTITVKAKNDQEQFIFSVKDTGIGIPKKDHNKVFSEFFRSINARKFYSGGTGVGLYLCKRYITGHGGTISFTSRENKGSTFIFTLPLKGEDDIEELLKVI